MNNLYAFIILILLSACVSKEDKIKAKLQGGWTLFETKYLIPKPQNQPPYPHPIFGSNKLYFEFIQNDSLYRSIPFFKKDVWEMAYQNKQYYLGNFTKYKVEDSILSYYNPIDSSWIKYKIQSLKKDTIELVDLSNKIQQRFFRTSYDTSKTPVFDKIVVSTSGCYGICPVMNISISKDGDIEFVGQMYTVNEGFKTAKLSQRQTQLIMDMFRKINPLKLKDNYFSYATDGERITISFLKNDSILKTIKDDSQQGPDEIVRAYTLLRFLEQDSNVNFKEHDFNKEPPFPKLYDFRFEKGNTKLVLPQSENFILWNYLREAKICTNKVTPKFKLGFDRNFTFFDDMMFMSHKDPFKKAKDELKLNIVTDGRYYEIESNHKKTCYDIGFNFFDRNLSTRPFIKFDKYDFY